MQLNELLHVGQRVRPSLIPERLGFVLFGKFFGTHPFEVVTRAHLLASEH